MFLDYGTLLGIVRDGDIIPWDDDIDFGIDHTQMKKLEEVLVNEKDNFPKASLITYKCHVRRDENKKPWYFSLRFEDNSQKPLREFEIAFGARQSIEGYSFQMRHTYTNCEEKHFEEYEVLHWNNTKVIVPYQYKEYLDHTYNNWRTPEEYNFGTEYGKSYPGDLEKIKITVKEEILF